MPKLFKFSINCRCSACEFNTPQLDCEVCGGQIVYTREVTVPSSLVEVIVDDRAKSRVVSDEAEPIYEVNSRQYGWVSTSKESFEITDETYRRIVYLSPQQSTDAANALEIAAKACDELGKSYGDRGYKAHPRSSDGIYDKCKAGKEASLLCAERVRNLITTQPTQSAAPSAPIEAQLNVINALMDCKTDYEYLAGLDIGHIKCLKEWLTIRANLIGQLIQYTQAPKESEKQ